MNGENTPSTICIDPPVKSQTPLPCLPSPIQIAQWEVMKSRYNNHTLTSTNHKSNKLWRTVDYKASPIGSPFLCIPVSPPPVQIQVNTSNRDSCAENGALQYAQYSTVCTHTYLLGTSGLLSLSFSLRHFEFVV
jgi:hypothetical protein